MPCVLFESVVSKKFVSSLIFGRGRLQQAQSSDTKSQTSRNSANQRNHNKNKQKRSTPLTPTRQTNRCFGRCPRIKPRHTSHTRRSPVRTRGTRLHPRRSPHVSSGRTQPHRTSNALRHHNKLTLSLHIPITTTHEPIKWLWCPAGCIVDWPERGTDSLLAHPMLGRQSWRSWTSRRRKDFERLRMRKQLPGELQRR